MQKFLANVWKQHKREIEHQNEFLQQILKRKKKDTGVVGGEVRGSEDNEVSFTWTYERDAWDNSKIQAKDLTCFHFDKVSLTIYICIHIYESMWIFTR